MAYTNLISSKQLIGELFADYSIEGTNWLGSVYRHIARGMEIMQLNGYFVRKFGVYRAEHGRVELPCDNKCLIGAVLSDGNCVYRIPIESSFYGGEMLNSLGLVAGIEARVEYNHLILNGLDSADIGFLFYAIPTDKDGYPMIIDNPFVLEALPNFILAKLALSGYKHPVISREEAEAKWNVGYPRARNNVNYPSIEEMEKFTVGNTNPFYEYTAGMELNNQSDNYLQPFKKALNIL